jgi:hypothetical protein
MPLIEIDDLAFIPPSVFAEDVAKLFVEVNQSNQTNETLDAAAAIAMFQSFNVGKNFGG